MNDAELRALVREAVARRLGGGFSATPVTSAPHVRVDPVAPREGCPDHPSHDVYVSVVNVDGACVIEPRVACDHCGYCKSHGH